MAPPITYSTGSATVNSGETSVYGQGTTWLTSGLQDGDLFWAAGMSVRIASVNSNTSLTLAFPWPGTNRSGGNYEVRFTPDASRAMGTGRAVLDAIANGVLYELEAVPILTVKTDALEINTDRETVNLQAMGAVPNGVTGCAGILNSLLRNSVTIVIPKGVFLIENVVGGNGLSDITFILMPGAVLKKASTLSNKMFQFNNSYRIRFTSYGAKGKIDVSASPLSGAGQANDAIYFAGGSGHEVDHLHIYAGASYATAGGDSGVFAAASDVKIHNNIFEGCWDLGVYLSGAGGGDMSVGRADVYENVFKNCNAAGSAKRLFNGAAWRDNRVIGGVTGFFAGESDVDNLPGINSRYEGNTFENLTGSAVVDRISEGAIVEGNRGINLRGDFIVLQGSKRASVKRNSLFIDPAVHVSTSGQVGIRVMQRTFNSITYPSTDNDIGDNALFGVFTPWLESDVNQDRNVYSNNRFAGNIGAPVVLGPKSYVTDGKTRRLQGITNGFPGTEKVETQVAFRSTSVSTLNIFTIPVPAGKALRVDCTVIATSAGAKAYSATLSAAFRRESTGSLAAIGTVDKVFKTDFTTAPDTDLFADTAVNAVRVRLTGVTGTTIDWVFNLTYTFITTNE